MVGWLEAQFTASVNHELYHHRQYLLFLFYLCAKNAPVFSVFRAGLKINYDWLEVWKRITVLLTAVTLLVFGKVGRDNIECWCKISGGFRIGRGRRRFYGRGGRGTKLRNCYSLGIYIENGNVHNNFLHFFFSVTIGSKTKLVKQSDSAWFWVTDWSPGLSTSSMKSEIFRLEMTKLANATVYNSTSTY